MLRGEEVDRLLARPALRVKAGVDDEPARAPHLVGQAAEVAVRVGVEAHLQAEVLRVESPALAERVDVEEAAERRQVGQLRRQRALEVMAGHRLVERQRRRGCRAGGSRERRC